MRYVILLSALAVGACTFDAKPPPVAAVNVYQSYENKVPGRWAVYVDGSAFKKRATMIGLVCSAHTFPVDAEQPFRASVFRALQGAVDNLTLLDTPPSVETLRIQRLSGVIRVTADSMQARLGFAQAMWTGQATARVEMIANVSVEGRGGRLLGTTAEGSGSADQSGGCPTGATTLAEATEIAMRRLVTTIAERVANSPRVRGTRAAIE